MITRVELTQSELNTFRTCRKKWWFRYDQKLIPNRVERALTVGTHVHMAIRALYKAISLGARKAHEMRAVVRTQLAEQSNTFTRSLASEFIDAGDVRREELLDEMMTVATEARAAAEMYVDAFGESDAREYEVVAIEREFDVPLGDGRSGARLRGQMDLVLRHKQRNVLVLDEHKTTVGVASSLDARLDVDGQVRAYLYAMRVLFPGEEIGIVQLNAVRKSAPKHPSVNKNGRVSVAKCDTTRAIYKAALDDQVLRGHPLTPEQLTFLDSLSDSTARWVSRHEEYIPPHAVDEWVAEARADARLMRASGESAKRSLPITRNPASCTLPWARPCAYRSICVDDSPERRATEYRVGQRYEELAKAGEEEAAAEQHEEW